MAALWAGMTVVSVFLLVLGFGVLSHRIRPRQRPGVEPRPPETLRRMAIGFLLVAVGGLLCVAGRLGTGNQGPLAAHLMPDRLSPITALRC